MVKLEIASIKYKKNGEYDYTIESDWKTFENDEKARQYVMKCLTPPTNNDYGTEYFFYKDNDIIHYDCIIEKDYFKS